MIKFKQHNQLLPGHKQPCGNDRVTKLSFNKVCKVYDDIFYISKTSSDMSEISSEILPDISVFSAWLDSSLLCWLVLGGSGLSCVVLGRSGWFWIVPVLFTSFLLSGITVWGQTHSYRKVTEKSYKSYFLLPLLISYTSYFQRSKGFKTI